MRDDNIEAHMLADLIEELIVDSDDIDCDVSTYADAEVMTRDAGLVIRDTITGAEYQITIIQSR